MWLERGLGAAGRKDEVFQRGVVVSKVVAQARRVIKFAPPGTGVATAKEDGNPVMRTVERMLFDGAGCWRERIIMNGDGSSAGDGKLAACQLKIPGWKKLGLFQ